MKTIYGNFKSSSVEEYKKQLHSRMFWLLLYKDPKTAEQYKSVDFDKFFEMLMREITSLEAIMVSKPPKLLELATVLQAAYNETLKDQFDYHTYRKLVLDAHSILDGITFEEAEDDDQHE